MLASYFMLKMDKEVYDSWRVWSKTVGYHQSRGLVEPQWLSTGAAVSCFARETFARMLADFWPWVDWRHMANIEIPIYPGLCGWTGELALFNASWSFRLCGDSKKGTLLVWEELVLFGTCGVLDEDIQSNIRLLFRQQPCAMRGLAIVPAGWIRGDSSQWLDLQDFLLVSLSSGISHSLGRNLDDRRYFPRNCGQSCCRRKEASHLCGYGMLGCSSDCLVAFEFASSYAADHHLRRLGISLSWLMCRT